MSKNIFAEFLKQEGIAEIELMETQSETHTAEQAASTHNVPVENIVKSLLVEKDGEFVLFLVPGDRKLDLEKINGRMANAIEVKEVTGYSIGGVPPFGHIKKLKVFVEEGFDRENCLLAAGGKPNVVFKIKYEKLLSILRKYSI